MPKDIFLYILFPLLFIFKSTGALDSLFIVTLSPSNHYKKPRYVRLSPTPTAIGKDRHIEAAILTENHRNAPKTPRGGYAGRIATAPDGELLSKPSD